MSWLSDATQMAEPGWDSSTYPGLGVQGSAVPVGSLLYADVIANALGANEVQLFITSHNFLTLDVTELGQYSWTVGADGVYTALGYLLVDGVVQPNEQGSLGPYPVLVVTISNSWDLALQGLTFAGSANSVSTATTNLVLQGLAFSGQARVTPVATMAIPLQGLTFSGSSSTPIVATMALQLEGLTFAGSSRLAGSASSWDVILQGLAFNGVAISGSVSLPGGDGGLPDPLAPSRTLTVYPEGMLGDGISSPRWAAFLKDPEARLDYAVDWGPWLAEAGDELHSFTVEILNGSDIVKELEGQRLGAVAIIASGGTVGAFNGATFHIKTTSGREDDRTIYFQVQER